MLLRVLQGEANPRSRLLQLGWRRLLGTIFLLDLRALDALLRFLRRRFDHLEQLSRFKLLQRSEDGFQINGHLKGLDGLNGFGGGHACLDLLGHLDVGCYYVSTTVRSF